MKRPGFALALFCAFACFVFSAIWWADNGKKKRDTNGPAFMTILSGLCLSGLLFLWGVWHYFSTHSFGYSKGRLLRIGGRARVAPLRGGADWLTSVSVDTDLPMLERHIVARGWLLVAQFEHASVPAFLRLAETLISLDAPMSLVARAYKAAREEVSHACICFGIASAYAGRAYGPAAFEALRAAATRGPQGSHTHLLAHLATACLRDGALAEGIAAKVARQSARVVHDPTISKALEVIAEEEASHAELGWDVMRFCLREGGAEVAEELERALADLEGAPQSTTIVGRLAELPALRKHGLLSSSETMALRNETLAHLRAAVDHEISSRAAGRTASALKRPTHFVPGP